MTADDVRQNPTLEEVIDERNRLWEELHRRAARDRELEHYRTVVEQMQSSLSWRLTAPLRTLKWLAAHLPEVLLRMRRLLARRPT